MDRPLRSAADFTDLPSDRNTGRGRGRTARAMRALIDKAIGWGPTSPTNSGDQARRNLERFHGHRAREINTLDRISQPGWLLEREPEDVRALLREVTSADVADLEIEKHLVHDHCTPRPLSKIYADTMASMAEYKASARRR